MFSDIDDKYMCLFSQNVNSAYVFVYILNMQKSGHTMIPALFSWQ